MKRLYCYSHWDFDEMCDENEWNDGRKPENSAFISICGTLDCQTYFLEEKERHWFNSDKDVLNLEFDDLAEDSIEWEGHIFYGLDDIQAEKAVKFIEENREKNFYVHCRAGKSRSQGFIYYILEKYGQYETNPSNPCRTPNYHTSGKLKKWYRKLGLDLRDMLEQDYGEETRKVIFEPGLTKIYFKSGREAEYDGTSLMYDGKNIEFLDMGEA